jgi:small subunit ribosomal protein S6
VQSYEMMLVFNPQLDEDEAMEAILQRLQGIITDDGGEITKLDKWGKRRLAYEIRDFTEGFYVVMQFRVGTAGVEELQRIVGITPDIIRHLLVRIEEK